jgi:hypothetical protein
MGLIFGAFANTVNDIAFHSNNKDVLVAYAHAVASPTSLICYDTVADSVSQKQPPFVGTSSVSRVVFSRFLEDIL